MMNAGTLLGGESVPRKYGRKADRKIPGRSRKNFCDKRLGGTLLLFSRKPTHGWMAARRSNANDCMRRFEFGWSRGIAGDFMRGREGRQQQMSTGRAYCPSALLWVRLRQF